MFRVFGIRLALHFTFPLLLAYACWEGWREGGWAGGLWSGIAILLLFTCVVLHELGHSLTARRFGIGVARILLLPIGGMAEFDSIPRQPRRELLITLAGPAVNFALVLLLLPWLPVSHLVANGEVPLTPASIGFWPWFFNLIFWVNLVMGCFNLVPVFPMDGGRILRALLALRWSYLKATYWASLTGKCLAIVGAALVGLVGHNLLGVLLFGFIFVAGDLEYRAVKRREEASAQWRLLLDRLYGPPRPGRPGPEANLLHGPN